MKNKSSPLQKFFSILNHNHDINKKNTVTAQKSLEQIFGAIDTLSKKADGRFLEKYPEFSERIKDLSKKIHSFAPDTSTLAGKTEQAIAQKITCVSSSCDILLSGGATDELKVQLADLEKLTQQRTNLV